MKQRISWDDYLIELIIFALHVWVVRYVLIWTMIAILVFGLISTYVYGLPIETIGVISGITLILSYIGCILWGVYRVNFGGDDAIDDGEE